MKYITVKEELITYVDDCLKMQEALAESGYIASLSQCQVLWKRKSGLDNAEWISATHYSTEEIVNNIKDFFE